MSRIKNPWVVVAGYSGWLSTSTADIREAVQETAKLVKTKGWCGLNHTRRDSILARFATREEAERFVSYIAGIRGEHSRRVSAANDAAKSAFDRLIAKGGAA